GADEAVALADGQGAQSGDGGSEVQGAGVGLGAVEVVVARDGDGVQVAEDGVVLADAEDRVGGGDGLPDPVVVAVDVDAEQADVAGEASGGDEVVDVLGGDEGLFDGQI